MAELTGDLPQITSIKSWKRQLRVLTWLRTWIFTRRPRVIGFGCITVRPPVTIRFAWIWTSQIRNIMSCSSGHSITCWVRMGWVKSYCTFMPLVADSRYQQFQLKFSCSLTSLKWWWITHGEHYFQRSLWSGILTVAYLLFQISPNDFLLLIYVLQDKILKIVFR